MNRSTSTTLALASLLGLLGSGPAARAQSQPAGAQNPVAVLYAQPATTPEARQRLFAQSLSWLVHLDRNRNGKVDPEELEGGRTHSHKAIFETLAQKAGLSASVPASIAEIRQRLASALGAADGSKPASAPAAPSGAGQGFSTAGGALAAVPGFGPPPGMVMPAPVPGFGLAGVATPVVQSSTAARATTTASASPAPSSSNDTEQRIRLIVEKVMERFDANRSGVLDPEEIAKIPGNYASAVDRNGDKRITADEIAAHLREHFEKRAASQASSSGSSSTASASPASSTTPASAASASSASAGQKPLRFLTPAERLPQGLPEWFTSKDANGDGQVSMAEYSSAWTEQIVADYQRFDANGDGMITPAECLAAITSGASPAGEEMRGGRHRRGRFGDR